MLTWHRWVLTKSGIKGMPWKRAQRRQNFLKSVCIVALRERILREFWIVSWKSRSQAQTSVHEKLQLLLLLSDKQPHIVIAQVTIDATYVVTMSFPRRRDIELLQSMGLSTSDGQFCRLLCRNVSTRWDARRGGSPRYSRPGVHRSQVSTMYSLWEVAFCVLRRLQLCSCLLYTSRCV